MPNQTKHSNRIEMFLLTCILTLVSLRTVSLELQCPEHFTCQSKDRSIELLQHLKFNSSIPNWQEICNCDVYCHLFGDCCEDAPVLDDIQLDQWTFVRVRPSSKVSFMSLMINRCPLNWNANPHVKTLCEQTGLSVAYDYLLPDIEQYVLTDPNEEFQNWHVTSRTSLYTYRNIYCSICNNDTNVESWSQRLLCLPSDNSNSCTAIYHQNSPDVISKEKLKRSPLQNKVHSSCSLGWYKLHVSQDTYQVFNIVKKCMIYYNPIVVQDDKSNKFIVFKNPYCAVCNGFDYSLHQCPSESIDKKTQMPAIFNWNGNFDTNFVQGGLISASENKTCAPGHVPNPFSGKCLSVESPIGNKMRQIANNHSPPQLTSLSIILQLILVFVLKYCK